MSAVWIGAVLEARVINRKIKIDLDTAALRSSSFSERGRLLTVTQFRDSSAEVPTRVEPWNKYR